MFKEAINMARLKKTHSVDRMSKGKYVALSKKTIPQHETFTEGSEFDPQRLPFLIPKSGYYLAFYLRHILAIKQIKKADSFVLDLGSAQGFVAELIHKGTYAARTRYIGIDANGNKLVKTSTKTIGNLFLIEDHIKGRLRYIKDDSIDVVVCMEFIEHMEEEEAKKLLSEIYRVSKNGARVIISTPNSDTTPDGREQWRDFHLAEFSMKQMQKMITKSGIELQNTMGWTDMMVKESFISHMPRYMARTYKELSSYVPPALLKQIFVSAFPEYAHAVVYKCMVIK